MAHPTRFERMTFAAENSVPDSSFGDLVRSLRGEQPVWSRSTPPPSLPEPRKPSSIEKRPFLRGSCRLFSTFPVSADNNGLSGGFLASGLCIQKFRSWRLKIGWQLTSRRCDYPGLVREGNSLE